MHNRLNHLYAAAVLSWGFLFDFIVGVVQSPHLDSIAKAVTGAFIAGYTTLVARRVGKVEPAPAAPPQPAPGPPPAIDLDALAVKVAAAMVDAQNRDRREWLERMDPADRRVRELAAAERRRIDEAAANHDPGCFRVYPDDML